MAKVYCFFADGLEETEAIAPVDALRRAGNEVVTVSIMGKKEVEGANGISIIADALFEDVDFSDGDLFIMPGGGLGTENLGNCEPLQTMLKEKLDAGIKVAAICAAPSILGKAGLLSGKKAVVYPGLEGELKGAEALEIPTVTDGLITTGRGPGAAIDFGLELVRVLNGEEKAAEIKDQMVYQH